MSHLIQYVKSPNPTISRVASAIQDIINDYSAGCINRNEYFELISLALDYNSALSGITDMNVRQDIINAFGELLYLSRIYK